MHQFFLRDESVQIYGAPILSSQTGIPLGVNSRGDRKERKEEVLMATILRSDKMPYLSLARGKECAEVNIQLKREISSDSDVFHLCALSELCERQIFRRFRI
jgi:hypothetical protein